MHIKASATGKSGQPIEVDPLEVQRSTHVDLALTDLRRAVKKTDHTLDSLAAEMKKDRAYIGKVLNGEKPMSLEFEVALPPEVQRLYKKYRSEHFGYIVVERLDPDAAHESFAAGLFSMLAQRSALPAKAGAPVKAELQTRRATDRERVG